MAAGAQSAVVTTQAPLQPNPHLRLSLDSERPPPSPGPRRAWYGWQTLLCDGLSIGSIVLFAGSPAVLLGFTGLLLATPIVHFTHDNSSAGTISLTVRTLSTLAFFTGLALALHNIFSETASPTDRTTSNVLGLGGLLGMTGIIVVDAAILAFDKPHAVPPTALLLPWLDQPSRSAGLQLALVL